MPEYSKNNNEWVPQQQTKPIARSLAQPFTLQSQNYIWVSPLLQQSSLNISYRFHTENYCMMFTDMHCKRGVRTGSKGPLCPIWTIEQFKLKKIKNKNKSNLSIQLKIMTKKKKKQTKHWKYLHCQASMTTVE